MIVAGSKIFSPPALAKNDAFAVVLLEPIVGSFRSCEHLETIRMTGMVVGIDVNSDHFLWLVCHHRSSRRPLTDERDVDDRTDLQGPTWLASQWLGFAGNLRTTWCIFRGPRLRMKWLSYCRIGNSQAQGGVMKSEFHRRSPQISACQVARPE
jgi:hypothetical protein